MNQSSAPGNVEDRRPRLKRTLGLFDATSIGIGAIVGAGIFVVTGIAAGLAGSALIISMLIAGTISLLTALSFAELSAYLPKEGGVYEFAYQLISPFTGFMTGWMWLVSNILTGAAVSLGFAYYFTAVLKGLPPTLIAATICVAFTVLNYVGVRHSANLNNVLVAAKLLILVFFVVIGLTSLNNDNFAPFDPISAGVFQGAFYIFFAYGGFARITVVAEEVKDPERNVPRAILLSIVISTIVYILVGIVAVGLIGGAGLAASDSPLSDAIGMTGSQAAVLIVAAGGVLATASVLLTSILGVSRMTYAMARRNDLPRTLEKLHPRFNTPYHSIWIIGLMMTLLVLVFDLRSVVAIGTFALLFYYSIGNIAALKLGPEVRRYPRVISALGLITCVALLAFAVIESPSTLIIGLVVLIAGAVYHVAKKRGHISTA
ncbi:MAG: amino acid permease [Methanomassiliicoccales archaeon]|nr:amino acid permease [Methanomassiliicoccales archaeon]